MSGIIEKEQQRKSARKMEVYPAFELKIQLLKRQYYEYSARTFSFTKPYQPKISDDRMKSRKTISRDSEQLTS